MAECVGRRKEGNSQEKDSRQVKEVIRGWRVALQDQWLQQTVRSGGGFETAPEDDQKSFYAWFVRICSNFNALLYLCIILAVRVHNATLHLLEYVWSDCIS